MRGVTSTLELFWRSGGVSLSLRLFLIMVAYYLLKPAREALILAEGSAEIRSYAVAVQAACLIVMMPLYSALFRHFTGERLYLLVSVFFIANLMLFYFSGTGGMHIGVAFFIWLGVFSVMQVAQFWGLAANLHSIESGQRLFAYIAIGGSLGAVVGSWAAKQFISLGPHQLILIASIILTLAIIIGHTRIHARSTKPEDHAGLLRTLLGGTALVMRDPYLRLAALFILLLNCINSLGEFILAKIVVQHIDATLQPGMNKGTLIGAFYSDFFLWVNIASLSLQLFMVTRIYRFIGVHGALLIPPLLAMISFAIIAAAPVLALVRWIKTLENSVDYSLQNTNRHTLFLPLDTSGQFEGKTAIDTLFWRLGDLIQAGIVFFGTTFLAFGVEQFALAAMLLACVWLLVAVQIGGRYSIQVLEAPQRSSITDLQELSDLAAEKVKLFNGERAW